MTVGPGLLRGLHGFAALLQLAQFGYAEALVNSTFKDRGFTKLTNPVNDKLNHLGTYQLSQLVPIFSLLSSVNHTWAFFDFKRYLNLVDNEGYNPVKFGEYAVSASLMYWIVSSLSSAVDVKILAFMVLSNLALQFTGYSIEKDVGQGHLGSAMRQEVTGFLIFVAQFSVIWTAFFTSINQSDETEDGDVPAYVYSIIFIITALFVSFGVVSMIYVKKSRKPGVNKVQLFRSIEVAYLALSIVSKSFLMNMVLFGSTRPSLT